MVLQEDVALFGFAEFITVFEFALCDGIAELLAAPLKLEDLLAVDPVLDLISSRYDTHFVPPASWFGRPFFCGQDIIEVCQGVGAFDFSVGIKDLVFEAKLCFRVCEVFNAAVDVAAFEAGVELIIESEIEAAVLVFCYDTSAEFIRAIVPISANDLAVISFPAGIQDLVVGCTLPTGERFAVEEQLEALADLLVCQGVRFPSRFRFAASDCTG